jgi:hypothetical protein
VNALIRTVFHDHEGSGTASGTRSFGIMAAVPVSR